VIYARFSTDLQNERSIEDQITLCRDYTLREGMNVVEVYEDRARSGGSVMGRGGLLRLLDQAREQSFDVVVVEALDRLSRDMEDLAGIHKRLSFLGIEIRAVHEGVVNTVLVGLRGLVGQLYREDNAHKVRRGLAGRVGQGLNAGGRAYGYIPVVGDKGKRVIVEAEAEVVRRIFDEYVAGRTPREIAHDLNNEGVSPPRGRSWNASTINGNMQRGTGTVQNKLYAGRLVGDVPDSVELGAEVAARPSRYSGCRPVASLRASRRRSLMFLVRTKNGSYRRQRRRSAGIAERPS
jgi:DNA invertase Pin-like site-specific DNA recombinase